MSPENKWALAAMQIALLVGSGATMAADKVHEANEGADTVSVLDAASLETLASVPVGKAPPTCRFRPTASLSG